MQETHKMQVPSLGWEDILEESIATHSSSLAWRISWTEETGGLQSIGSHRVVHDSSDLACMHKHIIRERKRKRVMKYSMDLSRVDMKTFIHYMCVSLGTQRSRHQNGIQSNMDPIRGNTCEKEWGGSWIGLRELRQKEDGQKVGDDTLQAASVSKEGLSRLLGTLTQASHQGLPCFPGTVLPSYPTYLILFTLLPKRGLFLLACKETFLERK